MAAVITSASSVVVCSGRAATMRSGDAAGEPLVAVSTDDAGQLLFGVAVDDVGGRPRLVAVHPHVERAFLAVREPAIGVVELGRRHAEVEQRAADLVDAVVVERLGELVETASARATRSANSARRASAAVERLVVLVDAEDVDVVARAQQRRAVAAAAEGRVDDGAGRDRGEQGGDLVDHHRVVLERLAGAHRAPPAISCWPRSSLAR